MKQLKNFIILSILFSFSYCLFCQEINSEEPAEPSKQIINTFELPSFEKLSSYQQDFKQYSKTVEKNYQALISQREPVYEFYAYTNTENFTLQGLASRCNLPYETLATLNQLESSSDKIKDKTLILPTVPGLFIPIAKGQTSIEILLQEYYAANTESLKGPVYEINGKEYVFLKNKRFTPTQRAFFLDSSMQLPIANDSFWVSSEFGKRKNPFSGEMKNHNGIDMAAAEGTPVYAIKDGAVSIVVQNDPEFGNYIILTHELGKTTSVYAHLKQTLVEQYQTIRKGDLIGYVGQTGKATGPHLHFEIRQGGKAQDPRSKLNLN